MIVKNMANVPQIRNRYQQINTLCIRLIVRISKMCWAHRIGILIRVVQWTHIIRIEHVLMLILIRIHGTQHWVVL